MQMFSNYWRNSFLLAALFSVSVTVFAQDGNPEPDKKLAPIADGLKQLDPKVQNINAELGDKARGANGKGVGAQMTDAQLKAESTKEEKTKKLEGSFIYIFDKDKVKPFAETDAAKNAKTREDKLAAYNAYEQKVKDKVHEIAQKNGLKKENITNYYAGGITGFSVMLDKNTKLDGLKAKAKNIVEIKEVLQDAEVKLSAMETASEVCEPEATMSEADNNWGTVVCGTSAYTGYYWAWVVDTGIDYYHSDLNVVTSWARTYVGGTANANDDNGHGTHCAGIIGAKANGVGMQGVAAGAGVVPIKVLNSAGSGAWSSILAGVSYVYGVAWNGDVMNMSLGGYGSYPELENYIYWCGYYGIRVTIAAGNDGAYAGNYTPARANGTNVYTVSAIDWNYNFPWWSNYGSYYNSNGPVDYAAPGYSIYATYKGNTYAYLSGTSMAAPHVAGVLLRRGGSVGNYGWTFQRGQWYPIATSLW